MRWPGRWRIPAANSTSSASRAAATRTSPRSQRTMGDGAGRIAAAFADSGKKAALMPYLMGGHPDLEASRACLEAAVEAGADLIELGIPFSDPLADGPVIHAAGSEALAAGVTPADVLTLCEGIADRLPVMLMVYANLVLAHGGDAFV